MADTRTMTSRRACQIMAWVAATAGVLHIVFAVLDDRPPFRIAYSVIALGMFIGTALNAHKARMRRPALCSTHDDHVTTRQDLYLDAMQSPFAKRNPDLARESLLRILGPET